MNDLLLQLRDKGNTVLVVEHKPEAIAIADHIVDLGPGAGSAGGTICYEGTIEGLRASGTVTGRHLDDRASLKDEVRTPTGALEIRGAATHMGEKGGVYVLDEPTSGLHLADVEQLLGLLDRLVDSGKSVIVIEHHQAVMAHADWIIDLGPGAGHDGGRVVFEGTPADLVAGRSTLTGEHLAAYVAT
jgi:excinuclease UvrABC ATPase subunit